MASRLWVQAAYYNENCWKRNIGAGEESSTWNLWSLQSLLDTQVGMSSKQFEWVILELRGEPKTGG